VVSFSPAEAVIPEAPGRVFEELFFFGYTKGDHGGILADAPRGWQAQSDT
jgi:hypothetical protein